MNKEYIKMFKGGNIKSLTQCMILLWCGAYSLGLGGGGGAWCGVLLASHISLSLIVYCKAFDVLAYCFAI